MPPTALQTDDYLAPATLARLGAFELRARMIVEGIRSGMHASRCDGLPRELARLFGFVRASSEPTVAAGPRSAGALCAIKSQFKSN